MPAYRLVRREDVELADGLPGHSSGLRSCRLVGGSLGSTHMALTLVSLASGHVDKHVHSFETGFYVLEGQPIVYLDGRRAAPARRVRRRPGRCPARVSAEEPALWIEMAAPRPRPDGSDTFFLGDAPDTPPRPLDVRDPRNRNLFLLSDGQMDLDVLKHGAAVGAPTVSSSMATAVLAYSGIAVKMLVDQRLDAQLHTMFMVDYQPGAVAHPHDHPFEESYYMLEGVVDVVAAGDRYTLRPGDVFWTAVGLRARLLRDGGRTRALARDLRAGTARSPLVPVRARLGLPRGASRMSSTSARVLDDVELYTRIYRQMLLIRGFEDLVQSLFLKGEVYGTTHLYSGQEAVATGVASLLEDRDRVAATYRGHGHALALGVDPQALLDEMLGRATGVNGGRAGSMNVHVSNRPPHRVVRDRRRQHRGGHRRSACSLADDGRRRGRVLRRRRDEPGLRLRVPELRAGPEAAARARVREQRLRRVHAVP